jgi:hypothetical protein
MVTSSVGAERVRITSALKAMMAGVAPCAFVLLTGSFEAVAMPIRAVQFRLFMTNS